MKKTIILLLAIIVLTEISFSQQPVKRNRENRTEQTKPTDAKVQPRKDSKTRPANTGPNYNGHEYVDLGLPSGLKWATCNVGATTSNDYGNYYAWGETATKSNYARETSITYNKTKSELETAGIINSAGNLNMRYDAARANWGGSWRMPTKQECEELKDKCTWTWTSQGGINGFIVTGPNGRYIFLPAAGSLSWEVGGAGEFGTFWASTCLDDDQYADCIEFDSVYPYVAYINRECGVSVRPVSE